MIDKVGRLAERVATGLSRRRFFTYVGRGGLALGAFLVGGLAAGHRPPPPPSGVTCTLGGRCCGGAYPYLIAATGNGITHYSCSADCVTGYGCTPSTCCNGGGSCLAALNTCYSDQWCNTHC
jgi:hypothetical protein